MTTPAWSAAQNTLPGNLNGTNQSAHLNQFLGTHGITPIYTGTQVLTPNGGTQFTWLAFGDGLDLDQPFVLSGTVVSRVTLPVQPQGNGADMLVTLYPDNGSGSPNTTAPVASTMVPAAAINQLAAVNGLENDSPPAIAPFNDLCSTGGINTVPWPPPTGDSSGPAQNPSVCVSGNYFIMAGGFTTVTVAGVNTVQYLGGSQLANAITQPSLPQATSQGMVTTSTNAVVHVGGENVSTHFTNVWSASWNPNGGIIGSWSAQPAYPLLVDSAGVASFGDTVYVIGGRNNAAIYSNVYYATVTNGNFSQWTAGPPLPQATAYMAAAVVGNWLVVTGGTTDFGRTVYTNNTYFAAINADGSLGAWQSGPSLPTAVSTYIPGWDACSTSSALVLVGGFTAPGTTTKNIQTLTFDAHGPSDHWDVSQFYEQGVELVGAFNLGGGQWEMINPNVASAKYTYTTLTPVPMLSVPLNATGLTNGATYHVVMQQRQQATSSDYLYWGLLDSTPLPLTAKSSVRHSGTWTGVAGAANTVPMTVYNNAGGVNVQHLVEDANSYGVTEKWSTLEYNNLGLLTAHLESTLMPNNPLNSNPTFTTGVSPWTVTGGTFVQSNAQTHGGFPFSGLLTPDGVTATVFAQSEKVPIQQGGGPFYGSSEWYLVDAWLYSTPGHTASLSVNWYDRAGTYLSTSSNTITLTAATWTHVQNWFEAPATAAQATINPTEGGTPAGSAVLYVSNAVLIQSPECVGSFTSAATVNYPSGQLWPPTGVTQLL